MSLRLAPLFFGILALIAWEALVRRLEVPAYIVPAPSASSPPSLPIQWDC